jgi:Ca2+-binding RTX toxin-like protein
MKTLHKAHKFQVPPLALVLGLAACMASPSDIGDDPGSSNNNGATPNDNGANDDGGDLSAGAEDPFDIDAFLGVEVAGCDDSGFDATSKTLTLTMAADAPAVVTAPSGNIAVNGILCNGTVGGVAGTQLTTSNVYKMVITGTGGNDKVILDLVSGTLGTKIFASTGGVTVNLGAGSDQFMVRGTTAADNYKVAKASASTDVYFELSGDKVADVKVTSSGTLAVSAALGAGNDTITGQAASTLITSFAGSAVTIANYAGSMTVYGGEGNDTITGGDGDDELHGGAGNDTFKMGAADDGGDTYIGDAGEDLVDYSNRTAALSVDIGASTPTLVGTVDLSTLDYAVDGALDGLTFIFDVDAAGAETATLADPTDPDDVVAQINAVHAGVAYLTGENFLAIKTATAVADSGSIGVDNGTGNASFGFTDDTDVTDITDADDGLSGEADDVQATTENITGGTGDDVLYGDNGRNVIKGGAGDDTIYGGNDTSFASAAVADSLQGEADDDTFYLPQKNYYAVLSGSTGTDTVNYSGRSGDLTLTNNGTVGDGESAENNNIAADIEVMVGGFGADTITGGTGADTLQGGPGNDILSGAAGNDTIVGGTGDDEINGGAGTDLVDYSDYTADITVTLCVSAAATGAATGCDPADDGDPLTEDDQVSNIEWVKGGDGDDTITASTVSSILEGGAGADTLTGGAAADALWGDAGDDTLDGGGGDDSLEGNAGDDELIGGDGDDICINDSDDLVDPVTCEL